MLVVRLAAAASDRLYRRSAWLCCQVRAAAGDADATSGLDAATVGHVHNFASSVLRHMMSAASSRYKAMPSHAACVELQRVAKQLLEACTERLRFLSRDIAGLQYVQDAAARDMRAAALSEAVRGSYVGTLLPQALVALTLLAGDRAFARAIATPALDLYVMLDGLNSACVKVCVRVCDP